MGNPELQQPGAGLSPGRAGLCGAVPNCCRLQPVTAVSPRGHICTCSSPGEQTVSHMRLSRQHQHLPPLCLSPAGGRWFDPPCSHCWGSAQLGAHRSMCQGAGELSTLALDSETSGDNKETPQQIFQNEDLQSLIIHTQCMEALCLDKQTSTLASVRPAAGLALIQARGKAFCLN